MPGMTVHVHDAYLTGEGTLHPASPGPAEAAKTVGRMQATADPRRTHGQHASMSKWCQNSRTLMCCRPG